MKIGVVIFPGSNCDHDMIYTLDNLMGHEVIELWHKNTDLQKVDAVVLPGGFSYGDYLRSGAIARFSPIMREVVHFADRGGLVFGVCNGFQVLCEAGLLPGTLMHNNSHRFICKNAYIKPYSLNTAITHTMEEDQVYKIPVAHAEGKYFASGKTMKELDDNDQILFKYCQADGSISDEANFNGSCDNIAGITNGSRNVYGMMPHPERAADINLGNTDGLALLENLLSGEFVSV